jgi:hypothetical protein
LTHSTSSLPKFQELESAVSPTEKTQEEKCVASQIHSASGLDVETQSSRSPVDGGIFFLTFFLIELIDQVDEGKRLLMSTIRMGGYFPYYVFEIPPNT